MDYNIKITKEGLISIWEYCLLHRQYRELEVNAGGWLFISLGKLKITDFEEKVDLII